MRAQRSVWFSVGVQLERNILTHVVYDSHFGYEYSRNGYAAFSKSASKKTNVGQ